MTGNVGNSFAMAVAEGSYDYYVIELSSFQLDGMYEFKADIAILLNITPDHLDRYEYKLQNYIDSKFRVIQNQKKDDFLIYWAGDPIIKTELLKKFEMTLLAFFR
jgi:UDP-N-acetylmuramoylalanine--D-glutamate ligase